MKDEKKFKRIPAILRHFISNKRKRIEKAFSEITEDLVGQKNDIALIHEPSQYFLLGHMKGLPSL
jgi:hypothetical protein